MVWTMTGNLQGQAGSIDSALDKKNTWQNTQNDDDPANRNNVLSKQVRATEIN